MCGVGGDGGSCFAVDPLQLGDLLDFAAQSAALIVAELVAVVAAAGARGGVSL